MTRGTTRKRPWLAAVLGGVVVGGGHIYLRRWRRALGWMILIFGVTLVFVPESALETLNAFEMPPLREVAPMLLVSVLSIADAYAIARLNNARLETATTAEGGDSVRCPNCGRETDADLAFCHWCSEPLPGGDANAPERPDADRSTDRRGR